MQRPIILIVEDDLNDQFLLKTAFKQIGVNDPIYVVNDGTEAIAYLKGTGQYADRDKFLFPTILLVDLKMPKLNGFELLRFLKNNPHLVVIPTVVFTSSADRNDVANAYLFGANAYHVKPPTLEKICHQLKVMHDYWITCEIPDIDKSGRLLPTNSSGKLSEKIPHPVRRDKF
jgi:CheY-like chemotaxis protein